MGNILLCGNGINIEFENKFKLTEFIDVLLDEEKLRNFFANNSRNFFTLMVIKNEATIFNISDYQKKIDNFCWIVKKCKREIKVSEKKFAKDGVEAALFELFKKVEEYLAFDENENLNYKEFESTFKELFFSIIWQLQNQTFISFVSKLNSSYLGFKNKLEDYMKIITLNYDTMLEKIIPKNSRDVIHWHGVIKEKLDGTLDYSKCLLGTVRNPKSLELMKQIPLFKKYREYKSRFELDVLGLNPMNDENVFSLFINSQICNKINFYYFDQNDLKNLEKILKKIQYIWLETNKSNKISLKEMPLYKRFDFTKEGNKKYIINFYEYAIVVGGIESKTEDAIEINLIHSSDFWDECKKNSKQSLSSDGEFIFDNF